MPAAMDVEHLFEAHVQRGSLRVGLDVAPELQVDRVRGLPRVLGEGLQDAARGEDLEELRADASVVPIVELGGPARFSARVQIVHQVPSGSIRVGQS